MYTENILSRCRKKVCCKGKFQKAASGQYIEKKMALSEKTKVRNHMQMTGVREDAPRITGTMCG